MKRLAVVVTILGVLGAASVQADHHNDTVKVDTTEGVRQCALQAESIQEKIKRLEQEVAKGTWAYSPSDLKKLELKLKEANETLDGLMKR